MMFHCLKDKFLERLRDDHLSPLPFLRQVCLCKCAMSDNARVVSEPGETWQVELWVRVCLA